MSRSEQARTLLYQHYPYRLPVIGWRHEMEQLSREDALSNAPNGDLDAGTFVVPKVIG